MPIALCVAFGESQELACECVASKEVPNGVAINRDRTESLLGHVRQEREILPGVGTLDESLSDEDICDLVRIWLPASYWLYISSYPRQNGRGILILRATVIDGQYIR